jgi:hypothetical protein
MTSKLRLSSLIVGLSAALIAGATGCDNKKTGADKFVGAWTYAGGITPNCGGMIYTAFDLTGYSTVITSSDEAHITVALGTICTVKFDVDGFTATAQSGQSCMLDLGAPFGVQTVTITKWTLTSTGVDAITSDFNGSASICIASGTGTLTRQGDAGTTD